ncbi:MAG: alkaline phosphatase family protein [Planctomycetales bacterium]|nr:alkaline phosphatase family protein [Planctomycetales bacterium]
MRTRRELLAVPAGAVAAAALAARGCGGRAAAAGRRLLVLGVDGLDPRLLREAIAAGEAPNLAALAREGTLCPLATTEPPESPVAWATFATGLPPSGHRVYDFVRRDPASYAVLPGLVDAEPPPVFAGAIAVGRPGVSNRRAGVPFWSRLRAAGIAASSYWVPVSFPPEPAPPGESLAGLGAPDLRGTFGSYTLYDSERPEGSPEGTEFGGILRGVRLRGGRAESVLEGPPDPATPPGPARRRLTVPIRFEVRGSGGPVRIEAGGTGGAAADVPPGSWSPWLPVRFRVGPLGAVRGRLRARVLSASPRLLVYVSPLQADLADPPVPFTAPPALGRALATDFPDLKSAGWSEETFARQEGVLEAGVVLDDILGDLARKGRVLRSRLAETPWSCAVAVVTELDRVCHLHWRDREAIGRAYRAVDAWVGEVVASPPPGTPVLVVSDHGFRSFRRGVNLNSWLLREGRLRLRAGASASSRSLAGLAVGPVTLAEVDWPRTRAYAVGLGHVYLNLRGRERDGIVAPGDAPAEIARIAEGLRALRDPATGEPIVGSVVGRREAGYRETDPFYDEAPDLLVGFRDGYRVSWQTALGGIPGPVVEPNDRPWCGDHCSAPASEVPGVLVSSARIPEGPVSIADVAPTALRFFGLPVPGEMIGKAWRIGG